MPVVELSELSDPRLNDFARHTDVELRGARGTENGIFLVESLLVLERALRAGHVPRAVLSLAVLSLAGTAAQLIQLL